MTTSREGHEFSPEPDREKSKAADWAMVVLTFFTLIAAVVSAWFFQAQLVEARRSTDAAIRNFMLDERAWVEIEPIRLTEANWNEALKANLLKYEVRPKNVGKTLAKNVVMKVMQSVSYDRLDADARWLPKFEDSLRRLPIADSPIPSALAPNTSAPVPVSLVVPSPEQRGEKRLQYAYIYGRVNYVDEFGNAHWMRFCYVVFDGKGQLMTCRFGNDEDQNTEQIERSEVTGRGINQNSFVRDIVIAIVAGLFASVMASFLYQKLTSRRREKRLRQQFSGLAGEYQESGRDAGATPTGGTVKLTYCGGTKFKTEGITHEGVVYWHGEIFMREEAGVLGAGYYSHTASDDTGTHEVIYNPVLGHFNVSGQNTSHPDGREFKMIWQRPAGTC